MMFYLPTGEEQDFGEEVGAQGVQVIRVVTGSLVPRTNRRHIRKVLTEVIRVKPQFVKQVMKDLEFWKPEDLGITNLNERYSLYAKAMKNAEEANS